MEVKTGERRWASARAACAEAAMLHRWRRGRDLGRSDKAASTIIRPDDDTGKF
jgi:hypothetical protein